VGELPTGTVTFLFTDLQDSTRLWEEHAETMQGALARHDELLIQAVDAHGGHARFRDGIARTFCGARQTVTTHPAGGPCLARNWGTVPTRLERDPHP
jgi:class 3 adenylate cyclase